MASIKTKFTVGLFVIVGFTVVIAAVIWLGMSHYLEKGRYVVAYFDESVQGLDKDSPVKYRGVTIGRVHQIAVAPDANLIQVVLKIEKDLSLPEKMVAQLRSVGITGIMYVELDRHDQNSPYVSPTITFPSKYPVIATKPSEIKKLMDAVNDVFARLGEFEIDALVAQLLQTLETLNRTIDNARLDQMVQDITLSVENIQRVFEVQKWHTAIDTIKTAADKVSAFSAEGEHTLEHVARTLDALRTLIADNRPETAALLADMRASLNKVDRLLNNSDQLVLTSSVEITRFLSQLNAAVKNYEAAGNNLNRLIEIIASQPSQLFFSEPSKERDIAVDGR